MRLLIVTELLLCLPFLSLAQVNCDKLLKEYDSLNNEVFTGYFEMAPTIITDKKSFEDFYFDENSEKGKVFVRFVVDTLGNVHCAKVIKSDNDRLNAKALKIIENARFTPAMNRGKKIITLMVLPVTFGDSQKSKRGG